MGGTIVISTKAFKAYDIRGIVPEEVNEDLAYRLGRALAWKLKAKKLVVGHDIRLSGPALSKAAVAGMQDGGAAVLDLGQCGTEMMYFATAHLKTDGGMMITASHNPKDYNGMKLVHSGARPISADTGLQDLAKLVAAEDFETRVPKAAERGTYEMVDIVPSYVEHLLSYINVKSLLPLKIVANPGNGGAGPIVKELAKHLPCQFILINDTPDGNFPNGVPNPLLPGNRAATSEAVKKNGADLGIAWDGDFDRCFFFDENGRFIEGYYLVGLFAQYFLQKHPGSKILYDPRLTWNTEEIIARYDGQPVRCKSGHAFIKECMRKQGVLYGGEMSAHHYFRDFSYCDSGMIPWLLLISLISTSGMTLSQMVDARISEYPCSGEINLKVADADAVLERLSSHFRSGIQDRMDGLSVVYDEWRFNLRKSNTEPVVRLNVETRGDKDLLKQKTREILELIGGEQA